VNILKFEDLDERIETKLATDPSYFAEKMLGMELHWYQKRVINDPYPHKAMCWSRQIGKSTMVAVYVVWYIFTHEKKNILILSQDRDASRRFYNMVITFILDSPILANSIKGEALQSRTMFKNGTMMQNKAPGREGKSVRGDAVDLLIIDEADFIAEEVFVAAEQTTAAKHGSVFLISTPNKKGSTFHQYFSDGMNAYKKAKGDIPIDEDDRIASEDDEDIGYDYEHPEEYYVGHPAGRRFQFKSYHYDYNIGLNVFVTLFDGTKRPQLSKAVVRRMKAKTAYWQFQQEYEAIWAEDTASYFKSQVIQDAIDNSYQMENYGQPGKIYYMGVDFAKHVDKTVVLIGEVLDDGRCRIVHIYSVQGRNWVSQKKDIMRLADHFPISKAYLDGTGVGDALFDELNGVESPLYNRCQRIVFTMPTKNNVYQNLSNLLTAGRIIIPHHKQLVDELMFLQYEKMEASNYVRIHNPKGMTQIGDDYPDALALLGIGLAKNLLIGAFTGYLVRKQIAPYPNFWDNSGDKSTKDGGAIKNPMWDVAGAKITRSKKKNEPFRSSRYVNRWS